MKNKPQGEKEFEAEYERIKMIADLFALVDTGLSREKVIAELSMEKKCQTEKILGKGYHIVKNVSKKIVCHRDD